MTAYFHYRLPDGSETAGWIDQGEGLAMTKLEQVARAIGEFDLDGASGIYEQQLMKAARAAVEALRDADQKTIEGMSAMWLVCSMRPPGDCAASTFRALHRGAIDAILNEKPE